VLNKKDIKAKNESDEESGLVKILISISAFQSSRILNAYFHFPEISKVETKDFLIYCEP
jgi:hypothetical protein